MVKAAADYVSTPNYEDGVACAIDRLLTETFPIIGKPAELH